MRLANGLSHILGKSIIWSLSPHDGWEERSWWDPARELYKDKDMFYDFLAKRDKPGGDTAFGRWNSRRAHTKQFEILRQAGAFRGQVLEIGPGEGNFARQCKAIGVQYKGIDRSLGLFTRLQEEGFDVVLGDVPPLPFESEQFDLVCALAVLEHMPTFNEALHLLQECNRVAKPRGLLALMVPDFVRCGIDFYNWDYSHSFVTTPFRVRQLLGDAGFHVERLVHLTGSLVGPIRWPIDLLGFLVHSRLVYFLGTSIGLGSWLHKFHKTFEPAFLVVSRKISG